MLPPVTNTPEGMIRKLQFLLPGNHPETLRALSFSFMPYTETAQGRVVIRSHFFKQPSEDDLELIGDLEAELYAQTDYKIEYRFEAQTVPPPAKLDLLPFTAWIDPAEALRKK